MKRIFHPFFSIQNRQALTIAELKTDLSLLHVQLNAAREDHEQLQADYEGIQENLKNCMNYLEETVQPEMETLRGQVADRDERIRKLEADLKAAKSHKKKSTKVEEVHS